MNPLFIIALVIWAVSAIGLIVLVLMHSGKGAGLAEVFGGSVDPNLGTGLIEKNLNRITIICASIFTATLILMIFVWPSAEVVAPEADDMDIPAIEQTLDIGEGTTEDNFAEGDASDEDVDAGDDDSIDDGEDE